MASASDEWAPDRNDDGGEERVGPPRNSRTREYSVSRFNSVVFDVDTTLSGIEGIDWLAALRGAEVEAWSAALTERAMEGKLAIEAVYGGRMRAVKPAAAELERLAQAYIERMAPRARETLSELRACGVGLVMVSGGLREAILPLARELGVDEREVHAVSVFFDEDGNYIGFDERSLLTRQSGNCLLYTSPSPRD